MIHARLLVFDDGRGRWGPLTDLRAVFDLRTGAALAGERIERVVGKRAEAFWVPPHLQALTAERHGRATVNSLGAGDDAWLVVNGRWTGVAGAEAVRTLPVGAALVQGDGQLVAAHLAAPDAAAMARSGHWEAPAGAALQRVAGRALLGRPWHILDDLEPMLAADLEASNVPLYRADAQGVVVRGDRPVRVGPEVELGPMVVIDARKGPVVIEEHALIGSMVVLEGPCYVGAYTTIAHHSSIRPNAAIGPHCKVAGEVSFSVIHGYTNKAHHGYMGHSIVGQWVNLGAATNVSNLKNTYGPVRVQLEEDLSAEDTGRTFVGPVIGDYVRTAIATKLLTGSCVGTGAMIAMSGYAPKCAGRFGFYTDHGREAYDAAKFVEMARRMMARRECMLTGAEEARLRELHRR